MESPAFIWNVLRCFIWILYVCQVRQVVFPGTCWPSCCLDVKWWASARLGGDGAALIYLRIGFTQAPVTPQFNVLRDTQFMRFLTAYCNARLPHWPEESELSKYKDNHPSKSDFIQLIEMDIVTQKSPVVSNNTVFDVYSLKMCEQSNSYELTKVYLTPCFVLKTV